MTGDEFDELAFEYQRDAENDTDEDSIDEQFAELADREAELLWRQ